MTSSGHIKLWNEVFGVNDNNSQKNIIQLWKSAQKIIDDISSDYRDLQKNFEWFTWGNYGHRLLFHWGFNADPSKYNVLVRQVRSCLKDSQDSKQQEQKFFAYLTRNIQARRNRELINSVINTTGIPAARGYANAIATILYDVHLLGDYETVNTSALPAINSIEHDLIDNGFRRLLTGGEKSERLEKIDSELRESIKIGRTRTNRKRAELLINSVKKFLPQILHERFSETLSRKGIIITISQ